MAAAVVNSNAFVNSSGSSQNIGWTPAVGNWLIVAIGYNSATLPTANTGWTRYDGVSVGANLAGGLFYRQVQSGDTATITPTTNFSVIAPWAVWEISGLPNGLPTDIQDFHMDFYLEAMKPMWAQNDGLILAAAATRNASAVSVLSGVTFDHTHTATYSGSRDSAVADKVVTAGTSFQIASTYPGAAYGYGIVILLNSNALGTVSPGKIVRQTTRSAVSGDFRVFDLKYVPTVGNWLVAILSGNDTSFSAATGWTQYDQNADGTGQMTTGVYYRQVQVGDTRTITMTNAATGNILTTTILEFGNMLTGFPTAISSSYKYLGKSPSPPAASSGNLIVWSTGARATGSTPVIAGTAYDTNYSYDYNTAWSVRSQALAIKQSLSGSVTATVSSPGASDSATWQLVISPQQVTSSPAAGSLAFTGYAPSTSSAVTSSPAAGSLAFTGYAPTTTSNVYSEVSAGFLTFTGYPPEFIPAEFIRASQFGLSSIGVSETMLRASQFGLLTSGIVSTRTRITQMGLMVIAMGGETPIRPDPLALSDLGREPVLRQRLVNMYVEPTPQGPNANGHFQRPGLKSVRQLGGATVNCTFQWQGFQYTVTDTTVWRDLEDIGQIPLTNEVRFATSETQIVIVSGGKAYLVTTDSVTQITDHDLPDNVIDVVQLAGRFIYIVADTGKWYYSAVGIAEDIDGLNFATTEAASDVNVGAAVLGDMLLIFGTRTTEWWYPTTDQSTPFRRSQGRSWNKGLAARKSLQLADNALWFIGQDKMVYRSGAVPTVMSNDQVSDYLRRVDTDDLDKCSAFTISYGRHVFYVVHIFGQGTWAYDIPNNKWAEWKTHGKDRFRVSCADEFLMGDYYTGTLMSFDGGVFTDLGDPIERVVSTFAALKRGVLNNFNAVLRCLMGVGLPDGYGSDPIVEMRNSDDLGKTWTPWQASRLGKMGERDKAVEWIQQGQMATPGRLFEFRCTDPVYFAPYEALFNEERP